MQRQRPCKALLALLGLLAGTPELQADGGIPGWNGFVYLIYQAEVTNYCGLTSDAVANGFRLQRDRLISEHRFSDGLVASARAEASKLAHEEWANRGLGGFRGWCQNDGVRYARQFLGGTNDLE